LFVYTSRSELRGNSREAIKESVDVNRYLNPTACYTH
jgi:hypothetical protein